MNSSDSVPLKLDAKAATTLDIEKKSYIDNESLFRFDLNEDAMATEKLSQGIRQFAADAETLKQLLKEKLS